MEANCFVNPTILQPRAKFLRASTVAGSETAT